MYNRGTCRIQITASNLSKVCSLILFSISCISMPHTNQPNNNKNTHTINRTLLLSHRVVTEVAQIFVRDDLHLYLHSTKEKNEQKKEKGKHTKQRTEKTPSYYKRTQNVHTRSTCSYCIAGCCCRCCCLCSCALLYILLLAGESKLKKTNALVR